MDLTTRRENDGVNVTVSECREVNGEVGMASEVSTRKTSSFSIRNLVGGEDDRPADGTANASEGKANEVVLSYMSWIFKK
ncbi:unnamed protein product [Colias eurytheme]|nr:unnamed protein product [Colias eurytheme]